MNDKEIKTQQIRYLRELSKYFNYNRGALADALGVSNVLVHGWFHRGRISAQMAIVAEQVTDGKITKKMLRPDVKDWSDEVR